MWEEFLIYSSKTELEVPSYDRKTDNKKDQQGFLFVPYAIPIVSIRVLLVSYLFFPFSVAGPVDTAEALTGEDR